MNKNFLFAVAVFSLWSILANAQTAELLRGPYLQVATSTSMVVRWRTDKPNIGRVRFGIAFGKLNKSADDTALTREHIICLRNLTPHQQYYYSIGDFHTILQGGTENFFYTLPRSGKDGYYRIGIFGDCGNNSVNQEQVKYQFLKYLGKGLLDAWILLGDNAYSSGQDAEFQQKFFNMYKNDLLKKFPLFPSPGNHDYTDGNYPGTDSIAQSNHQVAYYQNFSMPVDGQAGGVPSHTQAFYSFDIGNIHFLSLDSYGKEDSQYRLYDTLGPQVEWIKKDLSASANKQWIIAFWHHPPYTMGSHNSDREMELVKIRENLVPILERYGVDLILCGHSHDYERSRLMKGNFGMNTSFDAKTHNLSNSSGLYDGSTNSCPYTKDSSNQGTVYVVSGSAGQLGGMQKTWPHTAMYYANAKNGGALMLTVRENRLDLKWICGDGLIRDHFTMMKNLTRDSLIIIQKGQKIRLTASFIGEYLWDTNKSNTRSILVQPGTGTHRYVVTDKKGCFREVFVVKTQN